MDPIIAKILADLRADAAACGGVIDKYTKLQHELNALITEIEGSASGDVASFAGTVDKPTKQ